MITNDMLAMVTVSKMKLKIPAMPSGRKNSESFEAMNRTIIPIRQLWMTMYLPLQAVLWRICAAMESAKAMHAIEIEVVYVNSRRPFISQTPNLKPSFCKKLLVVRKIGLSAEVLDVLIKKREACCCHTVLLLCDLVVDA